MSYFTYFKSSHNNQWYFNFKANNHEIVLQSSEGYVTEQGCINGITSVKQNAPIDARYQRLNAVNYQFYFLLKAANGEPLGRSETYTTPQNRENVIALIKRDAPTAVYFKVDMPVFNPFI